MARTAKGKECLMGHKVYLASKYVVNALIEYLV